MKKRIVLLAAWEPKRPLNSMLDIYELFFICELIVFVTQADKF